MKHTDNQSQPTERFDSSVVIEQVQKDMDERRKKGIETYGTELKTFNGRDAMVDAYQESLDLAIYLKQVLMEEDMKYWKQLEREAVELQKAFDNDLELEEDYPPSTIRYERLSAGEIFFYNDCVYVKDNKNSAKFYQTDVIEHGFTGDEQVIVDSTFVEPFYEEHGAISEEMREIIDTALIYGNEDYPELLGVEERLRQHKAQLAKEEGDKIYNKFLNSSNEFQEYFKQKDKEEVDAWVAYCNDVNYEKPQTLEIRFVPRSTVEYNRVMSAYWEDLEDRLVFTDGTESYR